MGGLARSRGGSGGDMSKDLHQALRERVVKLPTDYREFGTVERWADPNKAYPDCSGGCRFFIPITGRLGSDWGVCANPKGPRFGLLTFEHQAGQKCFEQSETEPEWMEGPEWVELKI